MLTCVAIPRKQWRRDHPFGFYARPVRTSQGVLDLKKWECGIPGKDKTLWEGGLFKLDVTFPDGILCFLYKWLRILMGYWQNTQPSPPNVRTLQAF